MARLLEVLPAQLIAMVALPLLLGLGLLVALVDLPAIGWAFVYFVVVGGVLVMVLIGAHVYLLEGQQDEASDAAQGGRD
ncbi:hypothetical protein BRC81_10755 [Halobacteriales archaeon QS_1_68_20]|nr:MAG: hypothetical protein BRC81_10755 [Halobacteriales archaeon QS_1_68_20]